MCRRTEARFFLWIADRPRLTTLPLSAATLLLAADIRALLAARGDELDLDRLRDYYRLFDRQAELEGLFGPTRKPPRVSRATRFVL